MDDTFKEAIDAKIRSFLATEVRNAPAEEVRLLITRIRSLVLRGGKRMRPRLLLMTYAAYGGADMQPLLDLCVALEFHHQFLLIHDDVIDNDTVRYGGPNIVGYYSQDTTSSDRELPQAMGLLAGDLLFSFANQLIVEDTKLSDEHKVALVATLNHANIDVGYGQILDAYNIYDEHRGFTVERLLLIHSLKSAVYSIKLPMQCAVELCNVNAAERKKIEAFAMAFGVLFQLVDDYADYFTNESVFTAPKYRDFRQGKMTYPLYMALEMAKPQDRNVLKRSLADKNLSTETLVRVLAIMESCGAKEASRDYLTAHFARVAAALDALTISPESRQQFAKVVEGYKV